MDRKDWIWMPHPGHFIAAEGCLFRLCTYVGGYIVSTVGEYRPSLDYKPEPDGFVPIGCDRLYETMVFSAKPLEGACCQFVMADATEVDAAGYSDPIEARDGHMRLCEKWSRVEAQEGR